MNIDLLLNQFDFDYCDQLNDSIKKSDSIVIFGAGNLGKKIANSLIDKKFPIVNFVDNNATLWGTYINGIKVISLDEASLTRKESLFIISVWNPNYKFKFIKDKLIELNIKNYMHAAQIMQLYPQELLPHYHFQSPDFYLKNHGKIKEVYDMLCDEESKRQYIQQLNYRLKINFECLPEPDQENQYFPENIIQLKESEVFVDAGAYDGDTYFEFGKRSNEKYMKYIALEPDPHNYNLIVQNLANKKKVLIDKYAVGSKHQFLNFESTEGEGSSLKNSGDIKVECVTIDEKYYKFSPTFLKFDIEGAELDALIGAKNVIKDFTPKIAVCIYHKPEDIFSIPLYIKKLNNNYKFYVRTHGEDGFEFVLYAI